MLQTLGPGGSWWQLYLALWRSDFGACGALHCLAASGRCPYLLQPQPFERFPADSAQTPPHLTSGDWEARLSSLAWYQPEGSEV